ncbi:MAG: hypothetical protein ACLF0G_09670 [Candidatus Brocadiia bacterium]
MAKTRCACGRLYAVPDAQIGKPVKCAACGRTFTAQPAKVPQDRQKAQAPDVGELAVARGLVGREQLDSCIEYQEAIHRPGPKDNRRLGQTLLRAGLLSREQLASLLARPARKEPQGREAAQRPPAQFRRDHPVSAETRETLRQSVEAAARKRRSAVAERREEPKVASLAARLRPLHFAIVALVLAAGLLVVAFWPAPAPRRTLEAYLHSADEMNVAPDPSLAVGDLGIAVRNFSDIALHGAHTYDYSAQLAVLGEEEQDVRSWEDFLDRAELPADKAEALRLLLPAIPEGLGPKEMRELEITVQAATCRLDFKRRGTGHYEQGRYRFLLLRARSPQWSSGWRVASYERAAGDEGSGDVSSAQQNARPGPAAGAAWTPQAEGLAKFRRCRFLLDISIAIC